MKIHTKGFKTGIFLNSILFATVAAIFDISFGVAFSAWVFASYNGTVRK